MLCSKTGIDCLFGEAHVYRGDMFQCPTCHKQIVVTNPSPNYDPKAITRSTTIVMESR